VVQGCNDRICWGSTVNPMDVTDVYLEELAIDPGSGVPIGTRFEDTVEPVTLIPQLFRVNQVGDGTADNLTNAGIGPTEGGVTIVVPRRNHGPIVASTPPPPVTALSVQYTGWGPTLELEAFRRFAEAGTVEEFRDGVQFFDVGSQNWAYADVDGNIAYFTSAEMPLREDLQLLMAADGGVPPFLIRDGTHELAHEWLPVDTPQPQQVLPYEILPFAEMPQAVNPTQGWIANANNDPIGTTLDNHSLNQLRPGGGLYYLSPGYASLRMGRIDRVLEALLAGDGKASLEDLKDLQANNELLDAELIAPFLIAAFDAADGAGAPAELAALADDSGVAEAIGRLRAGTGARPPASRRGTTRATTRTTCRSRRPKRWRGRSPRRSGPRSAVSSSRTSSTRLWPGWGCRRRSCPAAVRATRRSTTCSPPSRSGAASASRGWTSSPARRG
jgi:penicillin G amidase